MIGLAKAKINIGLRITGKREDGYHLLDGLMYPIPLYDVVEMIPNDELPEDRLTLFGIIPQCESKDNLVIKAVQLFRSEVNPQLPYMDLALYKQIPFGAGLGGGSSNATTVLQMLCNMQQLSLDYQHLSNLCTKLGADCPFFIKDKPQIARGIGDILTEYPIDKLKGKYLLLIKPDISIATKEAFQGVLISNNIDEIEKLLSNDIYSWQNQIHNEFEKTVFPHYDILRQIKDWMINSGALYSSMSGSGATIYGIFNQSVKKDALKTYPDCFVFECQL